MFDWFLHSLSLNSKYTHTFFYVTGLIEMMALAHFRDGTISKHHEKSGLVMSKTGDLR